MDNTRDLTVLLSSGHPLIFVETREEERALGIIRRAAAELDLSVWTWSVTRGLRRDGGDAQYGTESMGAALDFVLHRGSPGVIVLQDAAPQLGDPATRRRLRETVQHAPSGQSIVVTGTAVEIPDDLVDLAHEWALRPPAPAELERMARRTLTDLRTRGFAIEIGPHQLRRLVGDLTGLTMNEAERAIQRAAVTDGRVDESDLRDIRSAKAAILNQDGILELIESTDVGLDGVGGLDDLKNWLALRRPVFLDPDTAAFLDPPRGILLTGVPGCGKSLLAKALAHSWELPLILLDPARLYGKYVGESEARLARTLDVIDAMSPAIVWIDEIEKGFATTGDGDGGVSRRILGTFLRWLQDRTGRIFLIATANDVSALPPELLRKGRFDEIFFVDVPGADDRAAIIRHHLAIRSQPVENLWTDHLVSATDGFSGAEIETGIVGALYRAHAGNRTLTSADLLREFRATLPLTRTRAEDIADLRLWARARARAA